MSAPRLTQNQLRAAICLGLALVTLVLYWPVTHHDFINVDDPRFVTQNELVQAGFKAEEIEQAEQQLKQMGVWII